MPESMLHPHLSYLLRNSIQDRAGMSEGVPDCESCKLYQETARPRIPARGNPNADVVIVGEAPGREEEVVGQPFVGRSGKLLRDLYLAAGFDEQNLYITNACCCYPHVSKNPKKDHIDACRPRLLAELQTVKPKLVIALGNAALYATLPDVVSAPEGILRLHGKVFTGIGGFDVIPIPHPAAILRNDALMSLAISDWKRAASFFLDDVNPIASTQITVLQDLDQVREFFQQTLPNVQGYAFDTETQNLDWLSCRLLTVQWSWEPGKAYVLPLFVAGEQYWVGNTDEVHQMLAEEFFDRDAFRIAQNMKFDCKVLRARLGGIVRGQCYDTALAAFLLDENLRSYDLNTLLIQYTDMEPYEYILDNWWESKRQGRKKIEKDYRLVPADILIPYSGRDADCTYRVFRRTSKLLYQEDPDLLNVLVNLLMPLQEALSDAEFHGIKVDTERLNEMSDKYEREIEEVYSVLHKYAPDINLKSTKQLAKVLYGDLGLPILKRTGITNVPSTDADTISALLDHAINHNSESAEFLKMLLKLRELAKIQSTYLDGLRKLIRHGDKVHTEFRVSGAETGRLSSTRPNMQNIPRSSSPDGIRSIFIPSRSDRLFLKADYAQIEFRMWGYLSQDRKMDNDIRNGLDIHTIAASVAYNVPVEEVTKELRNNAKSIVFGLMYGRGVQAVANQLKIDVEIAQNVVDWFYSQYPAANRWLQTIQMVAKQNGFVKSPFGRRRRLTDLLTINPNQCTDEERGRYHHALRCAMNTPIQSAASDVTCTAFIRLYRRIKQDNLPAQLLLIVHDEIDLEVDSYFASAMIDIVADEMLRPIPALPNIPLEVEITLSDRWAGNIIETAKRKGY